MNVVDILQATLAGAVQRSLDFLPQAQSALKTGNVVVCVLDLARGFWSISEGKGHSSLYPLAQAYHQLVSATDRVRYRCGHRRHCSKCRRGSRITAVIISRQQAVGARSTCL